MRRIILLRHAKSAWSEPGANDHERPLNRRGQQAARMIGTYLNRHQLVPECVLCSTATRARETWVLVAAEVPAAPAPAYEDRLYNAAAGVILDELRKASSDVKSLLLVGHNPGLQDLSTLLIASGDLGDRERLREKLPAGGLVVIDFPIEDWSKLHAHSGRLERFVVPRSLTAATD